MKLQCGSFNQYKRVTINTIILIMSAMSQKIKRAVEAGKGFKSVQALIYNGLKSILSCKVWVFYNIEETIKNGNYEKFSLSGHFENLELVV